MRHSGKAAELVGPYRVEIVVREGIGSSVRHSREAAELVGPLVDWQ